MFLLAQGAVLAASVTVGASDSLARAELASAVPGSAFAGPTTAYVVQPGDTLWGIASRFGTTVDQLVAANGRSDPDLLLAGELLVVPGPPLVAVASAQLGGITYVVQSGDTLWGIGRRFGLPPSSIAAANGIVDANLIAVGQVLRIPVAPTPTPTLTLPTGPGGYTPDPLTTAPVSTRPTAPPTTAPPTTVPPTTAPPTTAPPTTAPPATQPTYRVAAGDTLFSIARRFGVTVAALTAANGIADANSLAIGQVLVIPTTPSGTTTPPTTAPPTTRPPTTPTTTPGSNPPGGPSSPATVTSLPRSLFGNAATDPRRLALVPSFDRWADTYRLPRDLPKGVGFVESAWRADALSSSGAIGIGQLMPDTARWVAATLIGDPTLDPRVPDDNIRMSARYLRYLLDVFGGDETRAIAAYYQGPGAVTRGGVSAEGQQYVARVQAARAAFR